MAINWENTLEGVTDGATPTNGNSGTGGHAFDTSQIATAAAGAGTGAAAGVNAYIDACAHASSPNGACVEGTFGLRLVSNLPGTGGAANASYVGWTGIAAADSTAATNWNFYARCYYLFDAYASGSGIAILNTLEETTGTSRWRVQINNAGQFRVTDGTNNSPYTTKKYRIGEWTRVEVIHDVGGALILRVYIGFPRAYVQRQYFDTVADDTVQIATPIIPANRLNSVRYQIAASLADVSRSNEVYVDRMAFATDAPIDSGIVRDKRIPGQAAGTLEPPAVPTRCYIGSYPGAKSGTVDAQLNSSEVEYGRDYDLGQSFYANSGKSSSTFTTELNRLTGAGVGGTTPSANGGTRIPFIATFGFGGTGSEPRFALIYDIVAGSRNTDIDNMAKGGKAYSNTFWIRVMWEQQNIGGNPNYTRSGWVDSSNNNQAVATTLNGAVNAGDTSITLNSVTGLPLTSDVPFYVSVDQGNSNLKELVRVTSYNSTTKVLTLAAPGLANAHSDGITVQGPFHLITDYQDAFAYIVRRFHRKGAWNAIWVWSTATQCKVQQPTDGAAFPAGHADYHWNVYYPGCDWTGTAWDYTSNQVSPWDYVDWWSQDAYDNPQNWTTRKQLYEVVSGSASVGAEPASLSPDQLSGKHSTYSDYSTGLWNNPLFPNHRKPIQLSETGTPDRTDNGKQAWMTTARDSIKPASAGGTGRIPLVNAVVYFDTGSTYKIDTSPGGTQGWKDWIADSFFGGTTGPPPPQPSGYLATDTFTRTGTGGWDTDEVNGVHAFAAGPFGNTWSITAGGANESVNGSRGVMNLTTSSDDAAALLGFDVADVDVVAQFVLTSNPNATGVNYYLETRVEDPKSDNLRLRLQHQLSGNGTLILDDVTASVVTNIAPSVSLGSLGAPANSLDATRTVVWAMRLRCKGTTLQARAWNTAVAEPSTWNINVTSSQRMVRGGIAVRCQIGASVTTFTGGQTVPINIYWDNLIAQSLSPIEGPLMISLGM